MIRTATPQDAETVTRLLQASYPVLMAPAYDPQVLSAALPAMTESNPVLLGSGRFYLATSKTGEPGGCGGWSHERPGTGEIETGTGHIRHFAVVPSATGQGLGRALIEACETAALKEGVCRFECYSSLNAEGFYTSLGFTKIAEINMPIGKQGSLPSIHMEKPLKL